MMTFAEAQRRAWANKVAQGHNTASVPLEFCLAAAELMGEAFSAWRQRLPTAGEELADVAIYLFALAQMQGYDLGQEIERKMAINEQRTYLTRPDGVRVKEEPQDG
jgi:NTP pyrophosphatase (non-canonical NTP hydrolase)